MNSNQRSCQVSQYYEYQSLSERNNKDIRSLTKSKVKPVALVGWVKYTYASKNNRVERMIIHYEKSSKRHNIMIIENHLVLSILFVNNCSFLCYC